MKSLTLATASIVLCLVAPGSVANAQSSDQVHRLGFLTSSTAKAVAGRLRAFKGGMRDLGYNERTHFVIEQRHARGNRMRLDALAMELIQQRVHMILTNGGSATQAAARAARRVDPPVPVIFALAADPVETGLVASLSRPGGNVSGLSNSHTELVPKRLELLRELLPDLKRVAVLWSPRTKNGPPQLKDLQAAAEKLNVTLVPVPLEKATELDGAFAKIKQAQADAIDVFSWSLSSRLRKRIAKAALTLRLPTVHANTRNVQDGGLMGYGVDSLDLYRRAAAYVEKILKGKAPGDLPVERPTKFDLAVNLKTARALGINFPPAILFRATEVIE